MFRPNTVLTAAVRLPVRQLQLLVTDEQIDDLVAILREEDIDFARQEAMQDDEHRWLVQAPVPTDALSYLLKRLDEEGIENGRYTVVLSAETVMTPNVETLRNRFASDFDPLTEPELRSKVLDMSRDKWSFLPMILFSAIIATAGLLADSPAIVVGSMVIAPIVGPVLTAAVGATTGDREMFVDSIWLQGTGLVTALVGAWLFCLALQAGGFLPATLDISAIELISLRLAPGLLTVVVGLASGAAGAYGLVTKGPTSLIGVMIAAALIPAAATTGIATAWGFPRIAVGSLLLLVLTVILINVGAYVTLQRFPYRPESSGWLFGAESRKRAVALVLTAIVVVGLLGAVGFAAVQQVSSERTINEEVETTIDQPQYDTLDVVAVRMQYGGLGPFGDPEVVTVVVSRPASGDPPSVADELDRRVTAVTDGEVNVRVQFQEYQQSSDDETS